MAFDQRTRNLLQRTVAACRRVLDREFTGQLQELYGIQPDGSLAPIAALDDLGDEELEVARLLRERINHLKGGSAEEALTRVQARPEHIARVIREQAFTVLNRLAALRLCEERGLVLECVRQGVNSEGFQLFLSSAGNALGETREAYRVYLNCLFDELSFDLGVLFDRFSPLALLFPRHEALMEVLNELNGSGKAAEREGMAPEQFADIWQADETIGWIYQYYNDEAERKKMRDESAAPRDSRELAVRNQFFTPRYVVEFLADNTLGRIWYEMTRGETTLKEECRYLVRRPNENFLKPGEAAPNQPKQDNLSQEELLKQPVHIPHRPLKDPRTILMLDPACGSMHFGLYTFDLFEVIYAEAWALEEKLGAVALSRLPGVKTLHDTYASKDAFLRDVPRLIIEDNLHGIDIDPRCAQIAGLSLWLRAQKAWQRLGLKPAKRPAIKRSNIVCAEPMPGEKELLREFVEREFPTEERGVCLRLLEAVFDKMQLAGEAGSLLKIEEEIRSAIEEVRQQATTRRLFDADIRSLTSEDYWERIEERIYAALRDYAEKAENGGGFQRRLFAQDAARGFALIDLCRKKYDAVLMNPPFGDPTEQAGGYLATFYEESNRDIYSAFVIRGSQLLTATGGVGAITSRAGFFLSSMEVWRDSQFIRDGSLFTLADLGYGVLDAKVETAAYCSFRRNEAVAEGGRATPHSETLFIGSLEYSNKDEVVLAAIRGLRHGFCTSQSYLIAPILFRSLPTTPFAYGLPQAIFALFAKSPCFESPTRYIRAGVQTSDDFRFLRTWWEVPQLERFRFDGMPAWNEKSSDFQSACRIHSAQKTWCAFTKGGEYSPFFSDIPLVINWRRDGEEVKAYAETTPGTKHWSRNIRSSEFFFRAGLTYLARTSVRLCASPLPAGSIFSNEAGPGVFVDTADLRLTLGRFNSLLLETLAAIAQVRGVESDADSPEQEANVGELKVLRYRKKYIVGTLQRLPWPARNDGETNTHVDVAIAKVRALRATEESSHAFLHHRRVDEQEVSNAVSAIWGVEKQVATAYGVDLSQCIRNALGLTTEAEALDQIRNSLLIATPHTSSRHTAAGLIAYFVGLCFGRWDIRYATGEQTAPELPDPFAPLPVCPPGQLQNTQGLPARPGDVPAAYPVRTPWDGILVDDPNHPLDIERRVREVIEIIWGGTATSPPAGGPSAEALEHEACEILGVKSLRDYFRKPVGFFADHLKRYSKSRRQAPIYWSLSTKSGGYTLWIYYHRLTPDTLYKCVQQFVNPKLADVEKELTHLRTILAANEGGAKERKRLEELEDLRRELIELRTELERWAPRWQPNLNDGVLITAAPLWKLFRLSKWQKALKACWQELEKGDYEWAHLAYALWPERVRERCKTDRSIAIAHGLEDLCLVKAPERKAKRANKEDDTPEADLSM